MSRTNHPNRYNYDEHPYWKYQWWSNHAPASFRRYYNRLDRSRVKQAIRQGLDEHDDLRVDPPRIRRYIAWIWW